MVRVKTNQLGLKIIEQLDQYSVAAQAEVDAAAQEVGKECAKELRRTSPKRVGKYGGWYAKGWTSAVTLKNSRFVRVHVYNKNAPQISHLLEHGHAKANGGRVEGIPHIAPAEEKAVKTFTRKVEEALSQV